MIKSLLFVPKNQEVAIKLLICCSLKIRDTLIGDSDSD